MTDARLLSILAALPCGDRDYLAARVGVSAWEIRRERMQMRDAALVDLARRHYASVSIRQQAQAISHDLGRLSYQAARAQALAPRHLDDKFEALQRIVDLSGGRTISTKHIAKLIGAVFIALTAAKSPVALRHMRHDSTKHDDTRLSLSESFDAGR